MWLQEDTGTNEDCTTGACDGLHPVTIQDFAPKDWSSGYLKLLVGARLPKTGVTVQAGLRVRDTGGFTAYGPATTISSPGSWVDLTASLSDLASQGLNLSKIERVAVYFSSVSTCTSVLIDSLRLTTGVPPCAPNTVTAFPGDTQVSLSWNAGCTGTYPIAQYCVYRATYAIPSPIPVPLPGTLTRSCGVSPPLAVTGLTNGTRYYFKVAAVDTDGNEGPPGDVLPEQDSAVPTCGGTAPSIAAVSWSAGIRIMWSPVPGASSYLIYRAAAPGTCATKGPLLTTRPGVSVYCDDTTVVLTNNYCYTVTAVVGGCEGPCSNQDCEVYSGGGAPPCSPPGPILSLTSLPRQADVLIAWTQAAAGDAPISYYQVWRANTPGGAQLLAAKVFETAAPVYSWTNTGLTPVTQFCYQVVAVAENSCSSTSAEQCVTTGCDLVPPSGLSGVGWCDRVRLSWVGAPPAQYKIYRTTTGGACGAVLLDVMPGVSVYYDDMNVVDGVSYAYVVTNSGGLCDSACSTEAAATFRTTDPCPPVPPCTPPGVPATPTGTTGTARAVVTWSRPVVGGSPLSRYFVWWGAGSTGGIGGKTISATVWDSGGGPTFTVTVTGLSVDSTYCVVVEVADDGTPSCTNFSAEACFTTACVSPAPPGAPLVEARPPGSLLVSWTPALPGEVPISRYFVLRATASGGAQVMAGTVWEASGLNLSRTDTGLVISKDFWYQIMALDEQGCTSWSSETVHGCTSPGPISAVGVNARPPTSLLVSWAPPSPGEPGVGMSRYYVFRSTNAGLSWAITGSVYDSSGLNLSFTATGLNISSDYCFQVMAVDQAGCTIWSDPPPSTGCHACTPPGPISTVNVNARAPSSLLVSWSPPSSGEIGVGMSRYQVYRSTGAGLPQALAGMVYNDPLLPNLNLSFTNTGLNLTQEYCFQVMAVDEAGCTIWSDPPPVTGCRSCTPPTPVNPASLSGLPPNTILLGWERPAAGDTAVSRYLIFRATAAGALQAYFGTVFDDGISTSYSFTNTGTPTTGTWCYQVMAVDQGGCSSSSLDLCYRCDPPQWGGAARTGMSSVTAAQVNSTDIRVTWDFAPPGDTFSRGVTWNPVSRYFVYRSTGATCYGQQICGTIWDDQVSPTFSLTVTGLDPAAAYSFEIMAISRNGCGTWSVDCSGAGTAGSCSFTREPEAWPITGPTGTPAVGIRWGWSSTGTIIGFDILRGTAPSGGPAGKALIATAGPSVLIWTDSGVEPGKTYYYVLQLRAAQPLGLPDCTVYSAEAATTLPALKLAVYPNPAEPSKGPVRFDGLTAGSIVELYTLNGELVVKSPTGIGALWLWDGKNQNGTPVAPGIYLWIVRTEGKVTKGKLVVGK